MPCQLCTHVIRARHTRVIRRSYARHTRVISASYACHTDVMPAAATIAATHREEWLLSVCADRAGVVGPTSMGRLPRNVLRGRLPRTSSTDVFRGRLPRTSSADVFHGRHTGFFDQLVMRGIGVIRVIRVLEVSLPGKSLI